jgi:hypothetical protein
MERSVSREPGLPADPHPYRGAVVIGFLVIASGMLYSLWVSPAISGSGCTWVNQETWAEVDAARFVANGAYPYIYDGTFYGGVASTWDAGPLMPVVMAPVAALDDAFHMTSWKVCRPSLWYLYGPVGLGGSIPFLFAARALAWRLRRGSVPSMILLQVAIALAVLPSVAIVYQHFEDLWALAMLMLAIRGSLDERWDRSALFFALAIGFKQWAIFAVPMAFVFLPGGRRLRWTLITLGIPAVLYGIPLVAAPTPTSIALFRNVSWVALGHQAVWEHSSALSVPSTHFRTVAVLVACFLALPLIRKRTPEAWMAALTLAFSVRLLLLEPTIFAYWLAPVACFAILHACSAGRRIVYPMAFAVAFGIIFPFHPTTALWWAAAGSLLIALAYPSARTLFWRRPAIEAPLPDIG